jgi:hypothetical protein
MRLILSRATQIRTRSAIISRLYQTIPAATWLTQRPLTSIRTGTSMKKTFITFEYSQVDKPPHRHQRRQPRQHRPAHLHLQLPQRQPRPLLLRPERHRGHAQRLILVRRLGKYSGSPACSAEASREDERWLNRRDIAQRSPDGAAHCPYQMEGELREPLRVVVCLSSVAELRRPTAKGVRHSFVIRLPRRSRPKAGASSLLSRFAFQSCYQRRRR